MRAPILLPILLMLAAPAAVAQDVGKWLADGDAAYERRAEGQVEGQAAPGPIGEAVRAFRAAAELAPERLDVQWRLLRALYYEADFASSDADQERERYRRGAELSEPVLEGIAARLGVLLDGVPVEELPARVDAAGLAREDVARVAFWSAVHWGGWAREAGLFRAVREGVANRMFGSIRAAIALDPGLERGGPLRLLSRMHAELPRVPLITGWVDRSRALPLADRAIEVLGSDVGNRYLRALTQLELAPDRAEEARGTLREVAASSPRPELVIEDLLVIRAADKRLQELAAES